MRRFKIDITRRGKMWLYIEQKEEIIAGVRDIL
jgi:hypothetical protein